MLTFPVDVPPVGAASSMPRVMLDGIFVSIAPVMLSAVLFVVRL